MLENFAYVFTFLIVGIGFVAMNLMISYLIRPSNPTDAKSTVYDCGELPVGPGYTQFNLRFYLVTFVFVIFDVEIAFMYPITVIYKSLLQEGWGILALVEIAIFMLILFVGFIYAWTQGGLDWVRDFKKSVKLDNSND